ncbi:MAG: hypothetical protein II800_10885 [Lachnospiraceae bacterium]|nr:hypothetical protein [Lachnospiraceae bacterium]
MSEQMRPACIAYSLSGIRTEEYRPWRSEDTGTAREVFLDFTLKDRTFAAPLFVHRDGIYLWLSGDHGRLRAPILTEELKFFYPNPQDYYYLPMEDEAIHKSVSSFVERSHRVQATVTTCYTKKSGMFLPVLAVSAERDSKPAEVFPGYPERTPVFRISWRDHRRFISYPGEQKEDMEQYLLHVLSWFLSGSRKEPIT